MGEKIRVALAIGNEEVENWLKDKVSDYCQFVGIAIHRGQILTMLNKTMPDVLIFDVSLPSQRTDPSLDELTSTIRQRYSGCRMIILCDEHTPGDEFLTMLISKGIYDISMGQTVDLQKVLGFVFTPNTYQNVMGLQGLPSASDEALGVRKEKTTYVQPPEEQAVYNSQSSGGYYDQSQYEQTGYGQSQYIQMSYNQAEYEQSVPSPEFESDISDTSVLTNDMKYSGPAGIIFSPVEEDPLATSGRKEVAYTSDGYRKDNVLYGAAPQQRFGKIIAFTSAREGVGCTSAAINSAMAFAAKGKKVLLLDATFGRSGVYQRLGLPESYGNTMEDCLRMFAGGRDISQMPLGKNHIQNGNEHGKYLPESLQFLRFSDEVDACAEYNRLPSLLDCFLQYYDFMVVDTSLKAIKSPTVQTVMQKAAKVCLVTLQDIYEVNTASQMLTEFDRVVQISGKLFVVINRYQAKGAPRAEMIRGALGGLDVLCFKDDGYGYMRAYSAGRAYYPYAKRKTQEIYERLLTMV